MQYNRISADSHVDLCWMPPTLFVDEASQAMKDRMPYVTEDGPDGPYWTCKNGTSFGLKNGVGPAGAKYEPGRHARADLMAETNLYEDGKNDIRRITEPELRLKDMLMDGVDAEVIYGILGAASKLSDHEAANEMFRIYNDWLSDFCSHHPERHLGLSCLPYGDIEAACAEIRRTAPMKGIKGFEMSCSWDMPAMYEPMWEPLWRTVAETGKPLHFHTFPAIDPARLEGLDAKTRRAAFFTVVSGFQLNLVNIIAAVISCGALERYPNLRVAFGESGAGWIPYVLERMDFEWEDRFHDLELTMRPSDYWKRQCKATFQFDEIGGKLVEEIGVETLMWGSDYPHGDGVWPESGKYIEEQFGHLPADTIHKITCGNAAEFYGLAG